MKQNLFCGSMLFFDDVFDGTGYGPKYLLRQVPV